MTTTTAQRRHKAKCEGHCEACFYCYRPLVVRVTCPSTGRVYLLRVDPDAYGGLSGEGSARAAVASTWRNPDGSMVFTRPDEYVLAAAS